MNHFKSIVVTANNIAIGIPVDGVVSFTTHEGLLLAVQGLPEDVSRYCGGMGQVNEDFIPNAPLLTATFQEVACLSEFEVLVRVMEFHGKGSYTTLETMERTAPDRDYLYTLGQYDLEVRPHVWYGAVKELVRLGAPEQYLVYDRYTQSAAIRDFSPEPRYATRSRYLRNSKRFGGVRSDVHVS